MTSWAREFTADPTDAVRTAIATLRTALPVRVLGIDESHVCVLAALPGDLPPIVVHRPSMRVIDGAHRVRAAQARGETTIRTVFVDGDDVDVLVLAVRLNARHGLPLTRRDREAAVLRLLTTRPEWSDRRIAGLAGVSHKTVGAVRRRATGEIAQSHSVGADGRMRPRNPVERRKQAAALMTERPHASSREIARAVGLSPATVLDVRRRGADRSQPVESGVRTEPPGDIVPDAPRRDPAQDIEALRADPALRYSLVGRVLVRLLHGTLTLREPDELVLILPAHSHPALARLARDCGRRWLRIADELELAADLERRG